MGDLLFVCQRIPYPPNKGDKIRSWHFLRHFAKRYRVHLACLVDDPRDAAHVATLRSVCAEVRAVRLDPIAARVRCLRNMLAREPLSVGYFRHPVLGRSIDDLLDRIDFDLVFVVSSPMAAYVLRESRVASRTLIDLVDVDSQKWSRFAAVRAWPQRSIYAYEAARLLDFERWVARTGAVSLLTTRVEAELFRRLAPESAERIHCVGNGVDAEYFSPEAAYSNPYPAGAPVIVFTGVMDYWPNIEGVTWFAGEVMPRLLARGVAARLCIVGSNPVAAVRRLAREGQVLVTGAVPDVRPYLRHAAVAVAPLHTARGVQNKVLEAMAMACQVVASPQALEGIDAVPDRDLYRADGAEEFAAALAANISAGARTAIGRAARAYVVATHDWQASFLRLDAIVDRLGRSEPFDDAPTDLAPRVLTAEVRPT